MSKPLTTASFCYAVPLTLQPKPFTNARSRSTHHHASHSSRLLARASEGSKLQEDTPQRITASGSDGDNTSTAASVQPQERSRPTGRRKADSTDWVASNLTRRFGIAGGLAWLGILTFGVVSEQVKTRLEVAAEEKGAKVVTDTKEVVTPSGLRYTDLKVGGGQRPSPGFLTIIDYKVYADAKLVDDTKSRGKPIVFVYGSRPFNGGMCAGLEEGLASMKAGGKRRLLVPPQLGFGDSGTLLRPREGEGAVPPGATLEYELELLRVSIPPS